MEGSSTEEADLLSILQSSVGFSGIHHLFSAHLNPFTPYFKCSKSTAKRTVNNSKSKPPDEPQSIRTLARRFLSFIHKSLSLLPKRLSESPQIPHDSAFELFNVYRLCLDCLDLIAPELAGKPYSVQVQRIRYIHCLEHWELYKEAEAEGYVVLQRLGEVARGGLKGKSRKWKGRLVPELGEESVDQEVAAIVLEVVVTLVKCASKRRSKVDADYWRVISLVNESDPWFKILDAKDYTKFHNFMETNLHITVLFLVAEIKYFGMNLIREFSLITFREYKKSNAQDQMYKVALKICSSVFSQIDELLSDIIIDVLRHVLDFMASECKVIQHAENLVKNVTSVLIRMRARSMSNRNPRIMQLDNVGVERTTQGFLELVCYCANKCSSVTVSLCEPVSEHLSRLADTFHEDFPLITSVLTLYISGLLASASHNQFKGEDMEKCKSAPPRYTLQILFNNKERLQQVAASINFLNGHFGIGCKEKNSQPKEISLSPYWEALKFLCQSLSDSMYSNRKEFLTEAESSRDDLTGIHVAFNQFCNIFLQRLSASERNRETSGDNHRTICIVVVGSLMLSFKTTQNIKESILLVKQVISAEWVPVKRLKYLYVSLNNLAVFLNRQKRLKEAVKALKLCCKALWNYVVYLCKVHAEDSHVSHDDQSEKAIADFVMEGSQKVAFLMELSQEANCTINGTITESLTCWSISQNLIATLPTPVSLVKGWVKVQCLLTKDADREHDTMLYSLLSSSNQISKMTLGKLLEEELLAYDTQSHLNPSYCLRMRAQIIGILLEEVYVTKDSNLKKSRILIEKGKVLRVHGLTRLDDCIQCLSDAISTLKLIYSAKKSCSSRVHHLLIHAYILRALYTQEAAPESMVLSPKSEFLHDIHAALDLYLSPDHVHTDEQYEDMLYLWYQVIDLLSIKGYLEIHPRLYDVVIKLFNEKNFPLAKTVSELWKNRRLSHALCASPVNHMFIETFFKHQSQLSSSAKFWRTCMEQLQPLIVGFHNIDNEIKQAASDLISKGPLSSCSIFLSSNLYHDLAARLFSSGRMIEALAYAKEAHHLRCKLLQQKFEYSVETRTEMLDENGEIIEKSYYGIKTFKVTDSFMTKCSCNYEGCFLTPWNVLSCYLESILQVGSIQEILGNVADAEMLLRWGRNVSRFLCLPFLEIPFSLLLGKLYCKQKLWNVAEKELSDAKKTLACNVDIFSCKRCSCMLESSINQQIGDLFVSHFCSSGEPPSMKMLFNAKSFYRLALDKLNVSYRMTSYSNSEEDRIEQVRESSLSSGLINLLKINDALSNDKPETKIEPRRSRRTKKEVKPAAQRQEIVCSSNRRITRSTLRSLVKTHDAVLDDRHNGPTAGLAPKHLPTAAVGSDHIVQNSESECSAADLRHDISSLCNKVKCWHCLYTEAVERSTLNNFINMNWEIVYRKICLRLLISIGKFSGICGNVHEAHEILLQSISVLFSGNSSCSKYSSDPIVSVIESIGKHFPGDALAVERASLLYYVCWFTLKSYPHQATGNICCELSCIGTTRIVSLLKLSFILCREVPLLFQKISRLLAALYVLSTSLKQFSLSPDEEGSESRWASFFHQASLGAHLNQQIISDIVQKKQKAARDTEDSTFKDSVSTILDLPGSLRTAPESHEDLEEFVLRFYQGLPSTPVICISLVAGLDASLFRELLHCSHEVRAFLLLSHLSSDNQHVILLPVYETLEASADDASSSSVVLNYKDVVKQWRCPWVSSVIDDIAPVFRHVLEGNYHSSSEQFLEYIEDNKSLWWMLRNRLDECLSKFLQDMEDLWLGTWKYLLLGEWPDSSHLDSTEKNLHENEGHRLQLVVSKKCYVGQRSEASSESSSEFESMMQLLFKKMLEKSHNSDEVEYVKRKPIILVLDFEVQMLPWENLPILRNQEVYRMPSVCSIFATLDRCCQEEFEKNSPAFPLIDPLDSYYLLNPDGDLSRTQLEFESWFKDQNIEGKIGSVPTIQELTLALKNHDLFIYFGHGSGTQYIPGHEIEKLDSCAATLLLGCSSGSLYMRGCYLPHGAPISYLLAGSPIIVANLWEVTDKDIDRFGKAMLNAWLRERSAECAQCSINVNNCNHRPRIGSFMGQARDACHLGFLIGAAPVCYGVPTGIIKRK